MRKWMEKWGSACGALLCALVIIFSALYTRQDELKRLAARSAASDQNQTLDDAQSAPAFFRPVEGALLTPFSGAQKSASGWWKMNPFAAYDAAMHQEIRAVAAGTVTQIAAQNIVISHENGLISHYLGDFSVSAALKSSVSAGDVIARMNKSGAMRLSLRRNGQYIDPEAFFLSVHAE